MTKVSGIIRVLPSPSRGAAIHSPRPPRSAAFSGLAIGGPLVGDAAILAAARVAGTEIAFRSVLAQYDRQLPTAVRSAIGATAADSAWVRAQLDKREIYLEHLARLLQVSSATARSWASKISLPAAAALINLDGIAAKAARDVVARVRR